jgi:MYXO-CTERM domain-containing protein
MRFSRGWWVAFILAPAAVLADGSARAAEPAGLPRGVHLLSSGRYAQDLCDHGQRFYCMAHRILPESYRPGDSIEDAIRLHPLVGQGAGPPDLQSAYGLTGNSGGKIVAVLNQPDSSALSDVNTYRAQYGIPALALCGGSGLPTGSGTPCFASVDENGGSINQNIGDSGMSDGETGLDMDMISAACPDCSILLVQFQQPGDSDFTTSAATAARLGASATSISWGGPEQGDPAPPSAVYTTPGHLVLAASGDTGYLLGGNTPSYPGSAPDILGVGGTFLSGPGQEVVWNDGAGNGAGGSGCSTEFPMPAFQTAFGASNFTGCTLRDSVDVSAAAESSINGGGIAEYSVATGGWAIVVGTSAASPLVAGIFTRLGLTDAISADLGFIYKNIAAFNDITSGNNGSCSNIQCTAGPGWDGPTGVGTPNGAKLALLGSSSSSSSGGSSSGSSSGGGSGSSSGGGSGSSGSGSGSSSGGGSGGSGSSGGGFPFQGSGGDGGANNDALPSGSTGGCSCSTVGSSSAALDALAFVALGGVATALARRRRR